MFIKVAWDAQHQQFRLLDPKLAKIFEDGDRYIVMTDLSPDARDWDGQLIDLNQTEIGHA